MFLIGMYQNAGRKESKNKDENNYYNEYILL